MKFLPKELSKFQTTDREQCGILIETPKGIRIVEVPNADRRPESYAIRISDMEAVRNSLPRSEIVIGFFHTHLSHHDPRPSDRDFGGAKRFPTMYNCVYQPASGSLIWYGDLAEVEI